MNKIIFTTLFLILIKEVTAQNAVGIWYSKCQDNHYMLNLKNDSDKYSCEIMNLSKSVYGERVTDLQIDNIGILSFNCSFFSYSGLINQKSDSIKGFAVITNDSIPIEWSRNPTAKRCQVVKEQVPYICREIQFQNLKDKFKLSGTLTLPDSLGKFPAVVLITGSGPQDRNEDVLGHKTFLVLADYLTRNGIAVLRFDDRGTAKSEGIFKGSTIYDFAQDATAALKWIKTQSNIDTSSVGLIGHSEGGNVIAIAAEENKDVDFLVFLSGPGVSNLEMLKVQLKNIVDYNPEEYDYKRDYWYFDSIYTNMATINDTQLLRQKIGSTFDKWAEQYSPEELSVLGDLQQYKTNEIKKYSDVWYREFMKFDVTPYLKEINVPILALGGDKDLQVDSKQNLAGFEKTLKDSNHKNYKTIEIKNVNHFFQPCSDGDISKNYFNQTTFSEEAMKDIAKWIKATVANTR